MIKHKINNRYRIMYKIAPISTGHITRIELTLSFVVGDSPVHTSTQMTPTTRHRDTSIFGLHKKYK